MGATSGGGGGQGGGGSNLALGLDPLVENGNRLGDGLVTISYTSANLTGPATLNSTLPGALRW